MKELLDNQRPVHGAALVALLHGNAPLDEKYDTYVRSLGAGSCSRQLEASGYSPRDLLDVHDFIRIIATP